MSLFGVTNVHEPGTTETLEYSVTEWLKEGLLGGGAFLNVTSGTLLPVSRPGITPQTVYQSPRADWVWESGVAYGTQPTRPSGIYVDGVFRPFGSGCVPDYPGGAVTLTPALSGSPAVIANYSARTVRVFNPRAMPNYLTQFNSYDSTQAGSGVWSPDGRTRVQLPAVFVQAVTRAGRFRCNELGSLNRSHSQDVLFHVLAERPSDRDRLHDVLVGQWQTRFDGAHQVRIQRDGRQSLSPAGNINPSGVGAFTAQATLYPWTQIRVCDVDSSPGGDLPLGPNGAPRDRQNLYECVVIWRVECDLPI